MEENMEDMKYRVKYTDEQVIEFVRNYALYEYEIPLLADGRAVDGPPEITDAWIEEKDNGECQWSVAVDHILYVDSEELPTRIAYFMVDEVGDGLQIKGVSH
jgi:hypothetical protein